MREGNQVMLKKKKRKKKKREENLDHWTLVCCEGKMRRSKSDKDGLWAKVIRWDR